MTAALRERPSVQLTLLDRAEERPAWALEGCVCPSCTAGRMRMAASSDPCVCAEAICICLAEGYAVCDGCGELQQVWPREMVTHWSGKR